MTKEKQLAALVGILPVMMDFMEDVRDTYPNVYNKSVKKAGNDFVTEVTKLSDGLYKKMDMEDDQELREFYDQVNTLGVVFYQWLKDL
jgi:hypothetical protein